MRALTFRGFLAHYVPALSLSGSKRMNKLAEEAASNNPRLKEPLFLNALFSDNAPYLLKVMKSPAIANEYSDLLSRYDKASMEVALQNYDPFLEMEYRKVYKSYLAVRDKEKGEQHAKSLMRAKIMRLQSGKGVSNYRINKDFGINHGNMNGLLYSKYITSVSVGFGV